MRFEHNTYTLDAPHPSYDTPSDGDGSRRAPLLDIRGLCVEYLTPKGPVRAAEDVCLSIAAGQIVGLAGESGCGKSTVAHAIMRLLRPPAVITGGRVLVDGDDVLDMDENELARLRWR